MFRNKPATDPADWAKACGATEHDVPGVWKLHVARNLEKAVRTRPEGVLWLGKEKRNELFAIARSIRFISCHEKPGQIEMEKGERFAIEFSPMVERFWAHCGELFRTDRMPFGPNAMTVHHSKVEGFPGAIRSVSVIPTQMSTFWEACEREIADKGFAAFAEPDFRYDWDRYGEGVSNYGGPHAPVENAPLPGPARSVFQIGMRPHG